MGIRYSTGINLLGFNNNLQCFTSFYEREAQLNQHKQQFTITKYNNYM